MKKILLLLFFLPLGVSAKFYPGTVTMNDGTIKTGMIDIPNYSYIQNLKFKDSNGKTEKLSVDNVKEFSIANGTNDTIRFITAILGEPKSFKNPEIKFEQKRSWLMVEKAGQKIMLCSYIAGKSPGVGVAPATSGAAEATKFYLKKNNEDFAVTFGFSIGSHNYQIPFEKQFRNFVKIHFEKSCQPVFKAVNKMDLTGKEYTFIIDIYDQLCN